MANILTQEDDAVKQQETLAPAQNAVQSTGGGPATANPAAQTASAKPQGSGRFTNLQKYLGANEKASDDLTTGIANKGQSYMDKVREGINTAQGVQQGIAGERTRIGQAGQLAQGIQTDAVGTAQNNLADVTQLRLGQNQANQLQGQGQQASQNLSTNINPLDQFGQNLGSEGGRFQVLQDVYGGAYKPNYSMGQKRLDQLFLQAGDDTALNQLQGNIGQTVGQGNQSLGSLQKDLGTGVQGIRSGAQQAQQSILGAIGGFNADKQGAYGTLYGDLSTEQGVRRSELDANVAKARGQFGSGRLTQDVADMLGVTGGTNYGVMDLGAYGNKNINLGDTDVTMADVSDRKDYMDRMNALSQLSGTQVSDYDLGKKEGSDISFNSGKFTTDAGKHMTNYDKNVFDQSLYDSLGMYNPYANANYNNSNLGEGQTLDSIAKQRKDTSINDLVQGYLGNNDASFLGNGFIQDGYGTTVAGNQQSREQIQNLLNTANAKNNQYQSWYGDDANQFKKLLSYYDTNKKNALRIDPNSDLESGGNFNVK